MNTVATAEVRPSVCPLDCPDTCSLNVGVRGEEIISVKGSYANPFTAGVLCAKVSKSYPEFVHGANRLRHPLRRIGERGEARFERISWDGALDAVYENFTGAIARHGPQSVVPFNYAGPHGLLAGGSLDYRFFHSLGASLVDRRPLCGGIKDVAWRSMFGGAPGMAPEAAADARLVIVWSNNVTVSNLHLARAIKSARERGAKLVVIDPKRIRIAEQADLHLAPIPGTDVVLAYALAAELERLGAIDQAFVERHALGFELFMARAREYSPEVASEICGVCAGDIVQLAAWYAELSPAALSIGNGMERSRNGGSAMRAILALPVLAGKFKAVGGGVIAKSGNIFPVTNDRLRATQMIPPGTRTLNILDIPRHILDPGFDPPIKALFIYNHNPVATHPDQNALRRALREPDLFIVGCDVAMTDSMAYADIVLPAASHFEHADVFPAYGQQWLQRAERVIAPVDEALPNTEIFRRLARRFDLDAELFEVPDEQLIDQALDGDDPRLGGRSPSNLPVDSALPMAYDGLPPRLFENVFPSTPSGKAELYSEQLQREYDRGLPAYTALETGDHLMLITPSSTKRTNATFGGCAESDGLEMLEMHPADAHSRGLRDAQTVRVFNASGEVHLRLKITGAVRPGVLYSPKGTWLRTSPTGQTVNALMPTHKADLAHGACFNDALVRVAAV